MIDTFVVAFKCVRIPREIYSTWEYEGHNRRDNFDVIQHSFRKKLQNGSSIRYTYFPYQQKGLLKLEFSLPHLLYGNNVKTISNIGKAIDEANALLPKIKGVPKLNLWRGILCRLDICVNFQVKDLAPWYIKSLQTLEYPYRKTRPYTSQGVQYQNKEVILRVYDKARERQDLGDSAGASKAKGILRAEVELKNKYIKNLTHSKLPTLRLISRSWAYDVIEDELNKLSLIGCSIGTYDSTLKILRKEYGTWEALALIGLLRTKGDYPSNELLAQDAGLHPNSIGRHLQKKFAKNGIPATLTDYKRPLPPLLINR